MKNNEEDYKKKYEDAIKRAKAMIDVADNQEDVYNCALTIFPELVGNKDEKIRKELIEHFRWNAQILNCITNQDVIAWLEKQKSVAETVAKCKDSWYNEGKIAGQAEGLTDEEKYQQGWHDALENSNWNEDDEKNLQGVIDEIQANKSNAPACDVKTYDRFLSWLKSIKDRVQPQLKQKWTEEDDKDLENVLLAIKLPIKLTTERNVMVPDDLRNIWRAETWLEKLKERFE